jgi:predicted metal-dependent phosphotriesterase family hydrolase
VPKAIIELRRRGHTDAEIEALVFENPKRFLSQSGKFKIG